MDQVSALESDRQSIVTRITAPHTIQSSLLSESTGRPSQRGATWLQSMTLTMNSGFGSGAPRNDDYKGVREGREKGRFLPRIKGVGRTGKSPVPVPAGMLRALGVKSPEEVEEQKAEQRLKALHKSMRDLEDNVVAACQSEDDMQLAASDVCYLSNIRGRFDALHARTERMGWVLRNWPDTYGELYEAHTQTFASILMDIEDFRARVPGLRTTPRTDDQDTQQLMKRHSVIPPKSPIPPILPTLSTPLTSPTISTPPTSPRPSTPAEAVQQLNIVDDLEDILTDQRVHLVEFNLASYEVIEENLLWLRQELQSVSALQEARGPQLFYPKSLHERISALRPSHTTKYGNFFFWLLYSSIWRITKLHVESRDPLDIATTYIYILLDIERLYHNVRNKQILILSS